MGTIRFIWLRVDPIPVETEVPLTTNSRAVIRNDPKVPGRRLV